MPAVLEASILRCVTIIRTLLGGIAMKGNIYGSGISGRYEKADKAESASALGSGDNSCMSRICIFSEVKNVDSQHLMRSGCKKVLSFSHFSRKA